MLKNIPDENRLPVRYNNHSLWITNHQNQVETNKEHTEKYKQKQNKK